MEIYQLRYFAYAAKYENITMAAQELNVSQPSISKAIQSLERELKTCGSGSGLFSECVWDMQLCKRGHIGADPDCSVG